MFNNYLNYKIYENKLKRLDLLRNKRIISNYHYQKNLNLLLKEIRINNFQNKLNLIKQISKSRKFLK